MPVARVVPRRSRERRGRKDGIQAAMTPIYEDFGVSIARSSLIYYSDTPPEPIAPKRGFETPQTVQECNE